MAKQSGRPLAVFDIDGTLIRWQLYHALADSLARRGYINPETYQTMRAARMAWKRRSGGSFKDYERQVIIVYEAILKTLSFKQHDEAINDVFEEYKEQVYTYTRDLIADLKQRNYWLFAISGSQTEIVAKVAEYYGFDDYIGTTYTRTAKGFNGQKIIGSLNKDKTLRRLVKKYNLDFSGSLAIGDSHSDISMLDLVEQPIAFNPEWSLFEYAREKGWRVVIERKNVVYEIEKRNDKYELVKAR